MKHFPTYNDLLRYCDKRWPQRCPHASAHLMMSRGKAYHDEMHSYALARIQENKKND